MLKRFSFSNFKMVKQVLIEQWWMFMITGEEKKKYIMYIFSFPLLMYFIKHPSLFLSQS